MLAVHLAHLTERIKFGCGFNIAPMWHPLRLAEDFATADYLTQGRVVFGVAAAITRARWRPSARRCSTRTPTASCSRNRSRSSSRRSTSASFSHQGKHYTLPPKVPYRGYELRELTLVPRPLNRPVECYQPVVSASQRGLDFMARHGIKGVIGGGAAAGGADDKTIRAWQDALASTRSRNGARRRPGHRVDVPHRRHGGTSDPRGDAVLRRVDEDVRAARLRAGPERGADRGDRRSALRRARRNSRRCATRSNAADSWPVRRSGFATDCSSCRSATRACEQVHVGQVVGTPKRVILEQLGRVRARGHADVQEGAGDRRLMLRTNPIKAALAAGQVQIGTWINLVRNPAVLVLLKSAGLDYARAGHGALVAVDRDGRGHGGAGRALDFPLVVRPPEGNREWITRLLDIGVWGLHMPQVDTSGDRARGGARRRGMRRSAIAGMAGLSPGTDYSMAETPRERLDRAERAGARDGDARVGRGVPASGRDRGDARASTPFTIGPTDLAQDLGVFGTPRQAEVLDEHRERLIAAAQTHGKDVAMLVDSLDEAERWIAAGVKLIAYSSDVAILRAATPRPPSACARSDVPGGLVPPRRRDAGRVLLSPAALRRAHRRAGASRP